MSSGFVTIVLVVDARRARRVRRAALVEDGDGQESTQAQERVGAGSSTGHIVAPS